MESEGNVNTSGSYYIEEALILSASAADRLENGTLHAAVVGARDPETQSVATTTTTATATATTTECKRLALLECGVPVLPAAQRYGGSYHEIFRLFLEKTFPRSYDRPSAAVDAKATTTTEKALLANGAVDGNNAEVAKNLDLPKFILHSFDVVHKQEYPDLSGGQYDGVILTGSAASAYEDKPWLNKLASWLAQTIEEYPKIKLIGICFGHQIIARAMGGKCIHSGGPWEIGVYDCMLTDVGKAVFQTENASVGVQQMHQDQVPFVPPSFHLLAYTPTTPVHGLIRLYSQPQSQPQPQPSSDPSSTPNHNTTSATSPIPNPLNPARDIHILTIQGHPEYTPDIVHDCITWREARGILNAETVKDGLARVDLPDDGSGLFGKVMWEMLGVGVGPPGGPSPNLSN